MLYKAEVAVCVSEPYKTAYKECEDHVEFPSVKPGGKKEAPSFKRLVLQTETVVQLI
jgi:hypothetical protein